MMRHSCWMVRIRCRARYYIVDRPQGWDDVFAVRNDVAVGYARTNGKGGYPAGSVISAVTWGQQEDPRWFGGSIPAKPHSVEIVTFDGTYSYKRYEGSRCRWWSRKRA